MTSHQWAYDIVNGSECSRCIVCKAIGMWSEAETCRGRFASIETQRAEPDEEILRQLGFGLK